MPLSKYNVTMDETTNLMPLLDVLLHPETCLFINRRRNSACIMVIPKFFLHEPFFLHNHVSDNLQCMNYVWFSAKLSDYIASEGTYCAILCLECYTSCLKELAAKCNNSTCFYFLLNFWVGYLLLSSCHD